MKVTVSKETLQTLIAYIELATCFFYSYMNASLRGGFSIAVVALLCALYIFGTKSFERRNNLSVIFGVAVCLFFVIWRNHDISNGYYGRVLYITMSFFFVAMMVANSDWCYKTVNNLRWIAVVMTVGLFGLQMAGTLETKDMNILMHCQILIAICLAYICIPKSRKILPILGLILALSAMILSGKRGPILFHICAIATVLHIYYFKRSKKSFYAMLGIYALVIIIVLCVSMMQTSQFGELFSTFYTDEFSSGRVTLYTRAIDLFLEKPWFGHGWGGYRQFSGILDYEVHNIYLQMLCEIGIVGLLCFVFFFIRILKLTTSLVKDNNDNRMKLMCYTSMYCQIYFLLYGFTGNTLYDYNLMLYGFFAAIPVSLSITRKKQSGSVVLK